MFLLTLNSLGVLVRVDATPDEGKNITQSHGELIEGQWVEVIDEQKTPAEVVEAEETAKQAAKPDKLKQADNFYISVISSIPEKVGITMTDTTEEIATKLEIKSSDGTITELEAVKIGLKLQGAISEIERQGGSWYDLPTQAHNLEV